MIFKLKKLYNIKLILSCLKQTLTPTMVPVSPTGTRSLEEVDRAEEALAVEDVAIAVKVLETSKLLNIYLKEK